MYVAHGQWGLELERAEERPGDESDADRVSGDDVLKCSDITLRRLYC